MTPRVLRTTRRLPREMVELDRFLGLDGQGAASYEGATAFRANVLEYDVGTGTGGSQFVVMPDGSEVLCPLTLYVQGDEPEVPTVEDRVRLTDGRCYIVAERKQVSGLRYGWDSPDHYRLRCRRE